MENEIQEELDGLILNINKPLEWTSFDVVNRIKFHIKRNFKGFKNIKIGHAGTLDPLATGVLVVCIGKTTKQIPHLQNTEKSYSGTIYLGATRPSYDKETEISQEFDIDEITTEKITHVASTFIGKQEQMPPIFSAKKINGERAYAVARDGKIPQLKTASIEIFDFKITKINLPYIDFVVKCSKGTYIRSIAHDFGKKLNSGAYLESLCRTSSGQFLVENALELPQSIEIIESYLNKKLRIIND